MKYLYLLMSLVFITSCTVFNKSESVIINDATPPQGYAPAFISSSKLFVPNDYEKPELSVSFINTKQFDSTSKVYLHLIDNKKTYLFGASDKKYSKYWCNVYLTFDGKREPIGKYKLSEITNGGGLKNAIALVADHSGSMGESRAKTVQEAIARLIEQKRDQDAFALIRYDHRINVESPISNSKRQLADAHKIDGLARYNGMTAISDAIYHASKELLGKGYDNNVIMIFSDGYDNSSKLKADSVISYCIANNIKVFGVDFGANINPDYIKNISEKTGGFYRRIYKTNEFDKLFDDMYYRLNNAYVLEFDTDFYGKHFVEVELCLPKDTLVATSYFDNTPDIGQISLLQVNFDFNKSTLKGESKRAINKLQRLMKSFPEMIVELRGHTDSLNRTGDTNYNLKLSQDRADAVRNELIKGGIEPHRLKSIGYGDSRPIADNKTEEGRLRNRRTEFIVIKK